MKTREIIFAIIITFVISSCTDNNQEVTKGKTERIPFVRVETLNKGTIEKTTELIGAIEAKISATILSPADGYIEKLYIKENDAVKSGQLIAVVGTQERIALIAQTKQKLERLRKELEETKISVEKSEQLKREYAEVLKEMEYSEKLFLGIPVISSLSGTVTKSMIETGSGVKARDALFTVINFGSLIIKSSVSEDLFGKVKTGDKLKAKLYAYPNKEFTAIVVLKYREIDPVTRNFAIELRLIEAARELSPGMMVKLELVTDRKDNVLTLQNDVIIINPQGEKTVFVVKDSMASRRTVLTGINNSQRTEIVSGLTEGDKVVISGQEMLKERVKVKVLKQENRRDDSEEKRQ